MLWKDAPKILSRPKGERRIILDVNRWILSF